MPISIGCVIEQQTDGQWPVEFQFPFLPTIRVSIQRVALEDISRRIFGFPPANPMWLGEQLFKLLFSDVERQLDAALTYSRQAGMELVRILLQIRDRDL